MLIGAGVGVKAPYFHRSWEECAKISACKEVDRADCNPLERVGTAGAIPDTQWRAEANRLRDNGIQCARALHQRSCEAVLHDMQWVNDDRFARQAVERGEVVLLMRDRNGRHRSRAKSGS
jgi:hypothetical protein